MYTQEFYSELEKINREAYKYKILYESVHPIDIMNGNIDVLTEAVINKEKYDNLKNNITKYIKKALDKFVKMSLELSKRNYDIINGYRKIDINLVDFNNFEYEIPDIGTSYSRIIGFTPPSFNTNDCDLILNNNGISYKVGSQSKFQNGVFLDNGQVNRAYFDGTVNTENGKMKVNQSNAQKVFKDCLEVLVNRSNLTKRIEGQVRAALKVSEQILNSSMRTTISESVLLNNSIFKDEYLDILYEDAIETTSSIRKEEKDSANGIEINVEENKKNNNNEKISNASIKYNEILYSVQSVIMNASDKLYDEAGKYCSRVSQLSNKNNK